MNAELLYLKVDKVNSDGTVTEGVAFPSDTEQVVLGTYTYEAKRMGGAPTITDSFYFSRCLDKEWKNDENNSEVYAEYNGERFYVSSIPSPTKDNTNGLYKHEITLTSRREILDNTLFFDVVTEHTDTQDKDRYRSNQTKFSFGGDIREFIKRINDSLVYVGIYDPTKEEGKQGYHLVLKDGYGTDDVKEISIDSQYITEVIQEIYNTYNLTYYWKGEVCYVGEYENDLTSDDDVVRYGRNEALLSVSEENSNNKIVDMITGYGSSDNIPYYYPNEDEFGEAVFETENLDKKNVLIDLTRLFKFGDPIGKKFTFCKVEAKEYNNTFSVSEHDSFRGTADEYNNGDIGKLTVSLSMKCTANCKIKLSNLNVRHHFTQEDNSYVSVSFGSPELTLVKNGISQVLNELNDNFVCDKDGTYEIIYRVSYQFGLSERLPDGADAGYAVAECEMEGSITISYDADEKAYFVNDDFSVPYDNGAIKFSSPDNITAAKCGYKWDNGWIPTEVKDDGNAAKVTITNRIWLDPSQNLMPSIYRESKGTERFYYALNDTHKIPGSDKYYEFKNKYVKGNPHQGSTSFDDIKPTINGIRNDVIQSDGLGQLFGEIADVAFDSKDSDVKDSNDEYIHQYFYIKLHKFSGEFGFDLFSHALAKENAVINMIDCQGCPACAFPIQSIWNANKDKCYNCVSVDESGNLKAINTEKDDYILGETAAQSDKLNQNSQEKEIWIAVQKDNSTLGIVMPNAAGNFKPKKGDKFVITGIKPPKVLVTAAEHRLDEALIKYMSKNNEDSFTYSIKFSRIFLAENPDYANKLNENAKICLEFNGVKHELFVSNYSVKRDGNALAEVEVELVKSLETTQSEMKQMIDSVKGDVLDSIGSGLNTGSNNSFNADTADKMYISKLKDDTAQGTLTFEQLQKFLAGLQLGTFSNMSGGDWSMDEEGRSHLITDYLEVRMKAIFEELVIKKTSTIGGKELISPAGSNVISDVEEVTVTYDGVSQTAYRCYFLAEQDGEKIDNDWVAGDQARSESFNVKAGTYHKAGNHFLWRLVIGVDSEPVERVGKKYHYIDISSLDYATASDVPMKGDVVNQCGNRTDITRQNCLVLSAVDTYSPSIILYHGINSYSFENHEYVEYGVVKSTGKAFFNVYGDAYIGDRPTKDNSYEGDSYIKYDSDKKKLTIKAEIEAKSTFDGKSLEQYIAEKSLDEKAVTNIINNSQVISDLQNQIDGAIETWFYDGVPTLSNAPASEWKTDKDKNIHLGDLYYDNKTGKAYRFALDGSTYKWTVITDTDLTKALADSKQALEDAATADGKADSAQKTANSKRRIFNSQPTPPYDVNDMWVNATYPASTGATYKNDILRCTTAKASGATFAIADWTKASKYTDDTAAKAAQDAAKKAQDAVTTLDGTVKANRTDFDKFTEDGYLDSSEIAAMAQDSKRLEDAFVAAEKAYTDVSSAECLKNTKQLTDLKSAFTAMKTAKDDLVSYLSDIITRYNEEGADKDGINAAVANKYTQFSTAYDAFYNKLGLANAYITSTIYGKLQKNITDTTGLEYLKTALAQKSETEGGLFLTSLIALRDGDSNIQSGINGIPDSTAKGGGIATWWGGKMVDKDYNDGSETPANALIRFDGTGYFAKGALWWDADGKIHADPTSFLIDENNIGVYLKFFEPVWKSGSTGTKLEEIISITPQKPLTNLTVAGDTNIEGGKLKIGGAYLIWDSKNSILKLAADEAGNKTLNLVATGGISAYGSSSASGSGGLNGSVLSYTDALKETSESATKIASAYSVKKLSDRIDSVSGSMPTISVSVPTTGNALTGVSYNDGKLTFTTDTFLKSADAKATYAAIAHTHTKKDITDFPTKLSEFTNDLSYIKSLSWASRGVLQTIGRDGTQTLFDFSHEHSFSEIIDKPNTLDGYGIENIVMADDRYISLGGLKLTYDATNKAWKLDGNFYATGGISAYGAGSVSGSGGFNGSVLTYTQAKALTANTDELSKVASAWSIKQLSDRIDAISSTAITSVAWSDVTGRPTKLSQFTNDSGFTSNKGTVTSVALSVPTGFAVSGTPITTSGTLALKFAEGYSLPSDAKQKNWTSAYDWYQLMTTDEKEADGVINKWNEVVNFLANISQTDTLSGILDGINTSISTNADNIKTLQGYFSSGSAKTAVQLKTARKLWGNSFDGSADVSGNITLAADKYILIGNAKIAYDASNKAITITNTTTGAVANLYASGGITAYGVGSGSGGGFNGTVKSYASILKGTFEDSDLSTIPNAYSVKMLATRISAIEGDGATDISVTGSGNAVTVVSKDGNTITFTKGSTFLTSHQSLTAYLKSADAANTYLSKTDAEKTYQAKGDYLTEHQTIYGLTIQRNGTSLGTYTPNSAAKTINVSVPTKLSELTNDLTYIKSLALSSRGVLLATGRDGGQTLLDLNHEHSFSELLDKPNTLDGYGIENVVLAEDRYISLGGIKLRYDSKNAAWRLEGSLYATGGITAYGEGSASGGGGSNFTVKKYSDAVKLTSESLSDVASAYAVAALNTRLSNVESGSAMSVTVTGSGNAVTSISQSGTVITATKGTTFLTSHQSLAAYLKSTDAADTYLSKTDAASTYQKKIKTLTIFGTAYDGSEAKTITPNTFVGALGTGEATITDGTMFITSYASDNGFSDTNAVNTPYKRKASAVWAWINAKKIAKAAYADTAGSAKASDVYAWAKAATKPSYTWSEIGSHPTKLSEFTNDLAYVKSLSWASRGVLQTIGRDGTQTLFDFSHEHSFSEIIDKPNTLDGYGIENIVMADDRYISLGGLKLTYDATNKAWKLDGNFYATGGISAYGSSAVSGGGGGLNGTVLTYAKAILETSEDSTKVASAYSIASLKKQMDSATGRISTLEGGSATTIEVTGSGNAVTAVSKSGTKITFTKGSTFSLSSHNHDSAYLGKTAKAADSDKLDGYHEESFFRSRGSLAAAYVDLATYTKGESDYQNPSNGIYTVSRSGYSDGLIAFTGTGSASGFDLYFGYSRGSKLAIRRRIDSNRLSGDWEDLITSVNIGNQSVKYATSAGSASAVAWANVTSHPTKLSQFTDDVVSGNYLKLSGGTMTGVLSLKANLYNDAYEGALNMNNSNIYGLNSLYTADKSDSVQEGIHFYVDSTHVDTLRMMDGKLLFAPKRTLGTTSATEYSVIHSGTIGDQSVKYATTAGTAKASDVYAWAKAATKPSYTWSEIGSHPTKLSQFTNDLTYVASLSLSSRGILQGVGRDGSQTLFDFNHEHSFSEIIDKPNTLDGYGIENVVLPSDRYISLGGTKLSYDSTNKAWRLEGSLYATGGITAYGVGSGSSGSGNTFTVKKYSDAVKLTSEDLSNVASAYSISALATRLTNVEGGSAMSVSVSGSGNAVTSISKNGTVISVTKGTTFLTAHQSLANYVTLNGAQSISGAKTFSSKIVSSYLSGSWVNSLTSAALTISQHTGYGGIFCAPTKDGNIVVSTYPNQNNFLYFGYGEKGRTENSLKNSMYWDAPNDKLVVGGKAVLVAHQTIYGLTIQKNGTSLGTYTPNSAAKTINVTVPTKLSEFTNDLSYVKSLALSSRGIILATGRDGSQTLLDLNHEHSFSEMIDKPNTLDGYGISTSDAMFAQVSVAKAAKVANALSWSGYSSGSYDGSAAKSISIPSNTNQLTNGAGFITSSASITGNAATATKLQTARSINGSSFNGTTDITTAKWGTARNLGIVNSDGTGTAVAVSVDGSAAINLKLPATIKATLTGNASSATKLETARTIFGQSFNGTANVSGDLSCNDIIMKTAEQPCIYVNSKATANILLDTYLQSSTRIVRIGYGAGILSLAAGQKGLWEIKTTESYCDTKLTANGQIQANGNILATGGITAYQSSDIRLKENVQRADSLQIIKSLGAVCSFDYKDSNEHSVGLIAQNVLRSQFADLVGRDEKGYYKVNYWSPKLISVALGAVIQVDDKVTCLKLRIKQLEKRVKELESINNNMSKNINN